MTAVLLAVALFPPSLCNAEAQASTQADRNDDPEFVGPTASPPPPLTAEQLAFMQKAKRNEDWHRRPWMIFGVALAAQGVLLVGTVFAMALASSFHWDHDSGNDDDFYLEAAYEAALPLSIGSAVPMLVSSAINGTTISRRTIYSRGNIFGIALGGTVGVGLSVGSVLAVSQSDSEGAVILVAALTILLLPPIGEAVGYVISRKPLCESSIPRRPEGGLSKRDLPHVTPPMPTLIKLEGRNRFAPGLRLVAVEF